MAQTATAPRKRNRSQAPAQPQPRLWSHGAFHWNELCTRDVEGAKRFYAETIGWSFEAMPMPDGGTYWWPCRTASRWAASSSSPRPTTTACPRAGCPTSRSTTSTRASPRPSKAGAKLMKPAFDVPNVGRIAILMQPGGAGVGWMTPYCDQVAERNAQ